MTGNTKAWGGRFETEPHPLLESFSESVSVDWVLWPYDIEGFIAHATMLGHVGILTDDETEQIIAGLMSIKNEIETQGQAFFSPEYEDVHMNIEARLIEKIGDAGKKLHAARSRNDQVALDVRLYVRNHVTMLIDFGLIPLMEVLVDFAASNDTVIIPEFTHLQHAQPVLLAHHMMAYVEMLMRDVERLKECRARVNRMPLGSGACVGSGLPIDRDHVRRALKFSSLTQNSVDAVSDRDFVIEVLSDCAMIVMHLSRLSEELILWVSPSFNFMTLPDHFCTGSSMMPQKKNPDALELIRGKTGAVYGALMHVLTLMKGLPLTYNRDMQDDKSPLFETCHTVLTALRLLQDLIPGITVNAEACIQAAQTGYTYATDIADYLVKKGCPFRESHHIVGRLVAHCVSENNDVSDMSIDTLQSY